MKKLAALFLALICALVGCDVSGGNRQLSKDQEKVSNYYVVKLLDCLDKKDSEGIRALFSPEVTPSDDSIKALYEYYLGELVEIEDFYSYMETNSHSKGISRRWIEGAYKVTTNEEVYHIAVSCLVKDTGDQENIGIIYLYIINDKDYSTPEYIYKGDGKETPGINIGVIYEGDSD